MNYLESLEYEAYEGDPEWEGSGAAAWEFETNRSSPIYIAWVQHTLNQLINANLGVDGDRGAKTIAAVRSFQSRQGLGADGKVGPTTESRLVAALNGRLRSDPASFCAGLRSPEIVDRFDFNKEAVKPAMIPTLARIAQCVVASQATGRKVVGLRLVGHTDPAGSEAYNQTLSDRRARAVQPVLQALIDRLSPGLGGRVSWKIEAMGESQARFPSPEQNRRVEIYLATSALSGPSQPSLSPLSAAERAEYNRLSATARAQFDQLRRTIETYRGVARREADRGSRVLLSRGVFRAIPDLLPHLIRLTLIRRLPSGWSLSRAKPLLVGNVLYNLAFPETINQGGYDRLGGKPDPTCFSASTQILLARRFPATYVRYVIDLATTSRLKFAGGDTIGPLTFLSTSLYKSLESVLLQTAFDRYFKTKARSGSYKPGDELKVHRQVFGASRPPKYVTWSSRGAMIMAFLRAFVAGGGNTRPWELINLCTGNPKTSCGNHSVVLTRVTGGRVYFYNPWANEEEKKTMFGTASVSVSGNGERPAESSMTIADFTGQLTAVFHN